jgi:hypothetical protein
MNCLNSTLIEGFARGGVVREGDLVKMVVYSDRRYKDSDGDFHT